MSRKLFISQHLLKPIRVPKVPFRFFFDKLKYEIRKKSFDFRFYAEVETENIKIGGFPIFKITEH